MTNKTYTVVGTSVCNGKMKVRWATDMMRIKVLQRTGHSDIELFETPEAMDKISATKWLIDSGKLAGKDARLKAAYAALEKRGEETTAEAVLESVA